MASKKVGGRIQGDPNARSYADKDGKFRRGTDANAAKIGKEISDALDGQYTNSREMTRKLIIKKLANLLRSGVVNFGSFFTGIGVDPEKDVKKAQKILDDMDRGLMPPCHPSQRTGEEHAHQKKMHLHHKQPRNRGGAVNALWNLLFVSPKLHEELLDDRYHYGEHHGAKKEAARKRKEEKQRAQNSK